MQQIQTYMGRGGSSSERFVPALEDRSNEIGSYHSQFLDAEEAAAFLGDLNSRTITRWAREGYLPAYPIGEGKRRLWRFRVCDLERWMLSRMTGRLASAVDVPNRGIIQ